MTTGQNPPVNSNAPPTITGGTWAAGDPYGIVDLMLHFSNAELTAALQLQELAPAARLELVLTGNLLDGQPFRATDCLRLVGRPQR